jgi:hypothetical protein
MYQPRLWLVKYREKFSSMIFGQVMAKIRHGGGSHTFVIHPLSEIVQYPREQKIHLVASSRDVRANLSLLILY